jgi:hypothetical protein
MQELMRRHTASESIFYATIIRVTLRYNWFCSWLLMIASRRQPNRQRFACASFRSRRLSPIDSINEPEVIVAW